VEKGSPETRLLYFEADNGGGVGGHAAIFGDVPSLIGDMFISNWPFPWRATSDATRLWASDSRRVCGIS